MESNPTIMKGDWVHAAWFEATDACLSGTQMKVEAKMREVRGTITHIRGNHPTEPTSIRIWVQPDEGGDEVVIEPQWIKAYHPPSDRDPTGQKLPPTSKDCLADTHTR
jgi:hypothetical protein